MRICVGDSPLKDQQMNARLKELNRLRNDAIHRAQEVTARESQDVLVTIYELLKFMDDHGADFDLPESLNFWTP